MIHIPRRDVMRNKIHVIDFLKSVPRTRIRAIQKEIDSVRHAMQYSLTPAWENVRLGRLGQLEETDDAMTLMVKEVFLFGSEKFRLPMAGME